MLQLLPPSQILYSLLKTFTRRLTFVLKMIEAIDNTTEIFESVNMILPDLIENSPRLITFIQKYSKLCSPDNIHICDGSKAENEKIIKLLIKNKIIKKMKKMENCYLAKTDPKDVARVESRTFICTEDKDRTIPTPRDGIEGKLGKWMHPDTLDAKVKQLFPGSMRGRTMYVVPFSMGPIGGPLSKIGIQLTDSPYVVASMRIMTRVSSSIFDLIANGEDFVQAVHTVGVPLPTEREIVNNWPCDPDNVMVAHVPDKGLIISYGSGYGGNSLLGKKCFALRIGSTIARREGWLAEHMLIVGITNPAGEKKYIAAAFPSACGKTNLAMMNPSLPGWKVECVGDDIAWMKFDSQGQLRAINPENGFFGVAPGTSNKTNPNAMACVMKNTIFTNVGETEDGFIYWEGMDEINADQAAGITTWKNEKYKKGENLAAHPNSRFCTPAAQCPNISADWESPQGVPISAIVFGSRRPEGVPLVYQARDWLHGVFIGSSMRSEATAAAEHKGKVLMNDPFAMRPFFGYNFSDYLRHWISLEKENRKMPKIFHVNWFLKNKQGKFAWPGFGENIRVLEWILKQTGNGNDAIESPIGLMPTRTSINTEGIDVDMETCLNIDKQFWRNEIGKIKEYFDQQLSNNYPDLIKNEIENILQMLD